MKIRYNNKTETVTFGDIELGQCFVGEDNHIYLKIERGDCVKNSYDFNDDITYTHRFDDNVMQIETELTIK